MSSYVVPHRSYADPVPVRIQNNKMAKFNSAHLLNVKKKYICKSVPNLRD